MQFFLCTGCPLSWSHQIESLYFVNILHGNLNIGQERKIRSLIQITNIMVPSLDAAIHVYFILFLLYIDGLTYRHRYFGEFLADAVLHDTP